MCIFADVKHGLILFWCSEGMCVLYFVYGTYPRHATCRFLPPHFPQDKPVLKVVPPASHPWVDDNMIVTGCYGLNTVSSIVFLQEFIQNSVLLLYTVNFPTFMLYY